MVYFQAKKKPTGKGKGQSSAEQTSKGSERSRQGQRKEMKRPSSLYRRKNELENVLFLCHCDKDWAVM